MTDPSAALSVLGEPGWRLLLAAGAALEATGEAAGGDPLAIAQHLARSAPTEPAARRAAALELVTSGAALAAKLGIDERLLAVREAVEQASAGRVATWHAQRVPSEVRLLEIGCGCGGDSLALAHRVVNLVATDVDAVRAACAHMNLSALGLSNARVEPGDGLELLRSTLSRADAVFADPSRRSGGKRRLDPETWSPSLAELLAIAADRPVYAKLAPSLDPALVRGRLAVRFVSYRRSCSEAFVEPLTEGAPDVSAVLLPDDAPAVELAGERGDAPSADLGRYLHVPDPAAIRARLLAELCVRHGLGLVDDEIALLTGDALIGEAVAGAGNAPGTDPSPWLRSFEVLDVLDLHVARVGRAIEATAPSSIRVHTRGVPHTVAELEQKWRGRTGGDAPPLDVFATRARGRRVAVLARLVPPPSEALDV